MIRPAILVALLALGACAAKPEAAPATGAVTPHGAPQVVDDHVPPFADVPYEPFTRATAVAIALREWRLFGQPVDDDPPGTRPPPLPEQKPERQPGLWQRVGEYWWEGMDPGSVEQAWTGKHDADGEPFPANRDGYFAWSAAFISYVMRIAGATSHFPYSADHAEYINDAVTGGYALQAERPDSYAPQLGDLICYSRTRRPVRFEDLPRARFPAHCAIVVKVEPGILSVIGGNVDDAVTMTHVPILPTGMLAGPDETVLDTRYPWFVVLKVLYDTDDAPLAGLSARSAG
jgi:hypothetical protein